MIVACAVAPSPQPPRDLGAPPPAAPRSAAGQRPVANAPSRVSRAASTPGLEFDVDPPGAEILIDGQPRGTVAAVAASGGVLALPPGIYQVSLRASGRATWRAEVAVRSGRERIEVRLQPKP